MFKTPSVVEPLDGVDDPQDTRKVICISFFRVSVIVIDGKARATAILAGDRSYDPFSIDTNTELRVNQAGKKA